MSVLCTWMKLGPCFAVWAAFAERSGTDSPERSDGFAPPIADEFVSSLTVGFRFRDYSTAHSAPWRPCPQRRRAPPRRGAKLCA